MNSAKPSDKNNYLKLISLFIRKKPLILFSNLPVLVEAVVRSLDPNIPNLRETVLQTTTSILHDLVRTFPSITFHGRSQKLAVGTLEGASIIYDLRTATRWHVLEGHTKPVTAISFSMDGKIIVSCSLDERTVRVWNPSPGLLGMLTGSLAAGTGATREAKPFATTLSSSIKSVRTFGFNLGDEVHLSIPMILDSVHFEWVGERTVKLYVFVCKVVSCVFGIAAKRRKWLVVRREDDGGPGKSNVHLRVCISSSCGVVDPPYQALGMNVFDGPQL
ncbi:hypothetical protein G9A89_000056 [Geosiphon pyriformis]|nr:hypothetical protein G9A89_000056 [Geosiphon pyriformis]